MTHDELIVEMFGTEDWVATEILNSSKELVESLIKENLIRKAKEEKYRPIADAVVVEHQYLKRLGERFIPVPDKSESEITVLRTTVKVVSNKLPEGYEPTNTRTIERF